MPAFDYVVVGAGSAGCVLASRLTEEPGVNVLVLEAGGPDRGLKVRIPAAFGDQFHSKLDWDYATEREPDCDGRSLYIPRGRTVGGCSSMNAMLYVRGRPLDYDLWVREGAEGWGWNDVLPYFLRSEDNVRGASEFHGVGGPLRVSEQRSPRPLDRVVLEACEAAGIPRTRDCNGPEQDGATMFQVTQRDGRRWSAADAFLKPALTRPGLELRTGVTVHGLVLEGDRVVGVRVATRGRPGTRVIRANREVILCAGAIGSPQLLMLSGIGPADKLAAAGVQTRHALPGVGKNLQDHPFLTNIYEVAGADGDTLYGADSPVRLAEWLLRRSGKLTSTIAEVGAFVRTRPGLAAADVQLHMGAAFFEKHGEEEFDGHAVTLAPTLLAPRARGEVTLRSADPRAKPRIVTNTLSEPEDVAALVAGIRLTREIARQQPLAGKVVRELKPGLGVDTDADIEADLRRRVELIYHPVGTCRMGREDDEGAVLDPQLRVRGLRGVRVVDASVFPLIPGGNTNAPTIMVAERAADLIRGRAPLTAAAAAA